MLFLGLAILCTGCFEDKCEATANYIRYDAVWFTESDIRDIRYEASRDLETPGKIYVYGDYLFINEKGKGIHIYDNKEIANPVNLGFISILGNFDLAIKEDMLYADNTMDLVTIDISNINQPIVVDRDENVFDAAEHETKFIAYYEETDIIESFDCSHENFGDPFFQLDNNTVFQAESATSSGTGPLSSQGAQGNQIGIGGSFARFTIYQDYLYMVDESSLNVWDIANVSDPSFDNTNELDWGIETIFPYGDKLFIGSSAGMYIYDNSNPAYPQQLSKFEHARACDPVVIEGDLAYVTLRDGSQCEGFVNQLEIIDISNLTNPVRIATHDMDNPHGLSVRNQKLFLCDGDSGLKIFDVENSSDIEKLYQDDSFNCYDAISLASNRLMLIGADGFFQFDVSDTSNPELKSSIRVVK